jgi:hypothetical protein
LGSIEARIRRLEEGRRGGPCPECNLLPDGHGYMVLVDETRPERSFEGDADERCARCGQSLYTVIRVVYDPPAVEEEGEGA